MKAQKQSFKRHRDYGFFDQDIRLSKLSKLGDPLEKLIKYVDFELFRTFLEENLAKQAKGKGGRRPYDYVLMFKILILQRYYNISDDQVEYQVNDRMSFMRFLGLTIADDVPDSRTVWNFRQQLVDLELVEPIFNLFSDQLESLNMVANEGKIVDASFVEVPKQRNTREENATIKGGGIPASFLDNPERAYQKDTDARWTKKNDVSYFGYKNHTKVDLKSKLIVKYTVTDASVHDSQVLDKLLDINDIGQELYADSAYTGPKQEEVVNKNKMINKVCEKGHKNNPLTKEQEEGNKTKSRSRARVEHIYGFMETAMNGMYLYAVGKKRIEGIIGLMNLTYNMFRLVQLTMAKQWRGV